MAGLYENIYDLQNQKTLTFLYRAPKILMEPLSLSAIAGSYEMILGVEKETAGYMARLTKGYAFAYQVLGYLYFRSFNEKNIKGSPADILPAFDQYLETYVYEKIWTELSPKEREVMAALNDETPVKVAEVREKLTMSSGEMSVYRDRLNKKGILDVGQYGYLSLKLPRFRQVISLWI